VKRQHLIARYEHNYFRGWVVAIKRQGKRFTRYFSDRPNGRSTALQKARAFRDKLVSELPWPTKIKRKDVRNTTGVIRVADLQRLEPLALWISCRLPTMWEAFSELANR